MRFLIFFSTLLVLLFSTCKKGKNNSEACNGDTRRDVKLLRDTKAPLVDTTPIFTTIDSLGSITVPSNVKSETERLDLELKTYTISCAVEEVDRKRDGDYHILLKNGDKYLIAEVPNPSCDYAKGSNWNAAFRTVVDFIEANDLEGKEVEITGIAFVDIDHYYKRKQAANNLELHPIIKIKF